MIESDSYNEFISHAEEEYLASKSSERTNDGLVFSGLTIQFELRNHLINEHGVLQVTCYAVIPPHYNSSVSTWVTHNMVSGSSNTVLMNDRRQSPISTLSHTNNAGRSKNKTLALINPTKSSTHTILQEKYLNEAQKILRNSEFIFDWRSRG
ncbi:hypothetical protein GQR58_012486 [Nymphon striatum]|nr:hypothetical protein GQR58_012486 [Nymphon striatum]